MLLVLLALGFVFRQLLATNARVVLLISQQFSLGPVKPLNLLTRSPLHRRLVLPSPHGPVVADLFLPRPWLGSRAANSTPAIILAFGVKVPLLRRRRAVGGGRPAGIAGWLLGVQSTLNLIFLISLTAAMRSPRVNVSRPVRWRG